MTARTNNTATTLAPSPTRTRLIQCASDLFARHGFAPIGLDRVIDDAGVTKTTFYNHFASKDDLIIAVLTYQHEVQTADLIADLEDRAGHDPREQLLAMFDVFHEWFGQPEFNGCIFLNAATEFPIETDPVHQAAVRHGQEFLKFMAGKCVEAGVDPAEATDVATQIYLLVCGALIMRQTAKLRDAALIAKRSAETLLGRAVVAAG
jgi:AcrR family transcriptional regulator